MRGGPLDFRAQRVMLAQSNGHPPTREPGLERPEQLGVTVLNEPTEPELSNPGDADSSVARAMLEAWPSAPSSVHLAVDASIFELPPGLHAPIRAMLEFVAEGTSVVVSPVRFEASPDDDDSGFASE
jgi:hypothetical protein